MDLPFDPDLILFGSVHLTWHALFGSLGIVAGAALGVRLVASRIPFNDAYAVAVTGVLGGIVGSRIFHVVDAWGQLYANDPLAVLAVWNGGASIIGGIVGGFAAAGLASRRWRLPVADVLQRGTIGLPLGMAVGRVGDFINGEHWATACSGVPWCVRYTAANSPGQRDLVHPAVLYELVLDLAILAVLLALLPWAERQPRRPWIPFVFLGLYGIGRFALGAFRLDPLFAFGLSEAQLTSIAFVIVSLAGIAWLRRAAPSMAG
jgi:phosphatidylglycerol---prolipoprotein diacylglyceryl transferase